MNIMTPRQLIDTMPANFAELVVCYITEDQNGDHLQVNCKPANDTGYDSVIVLIFTEYLPNNDGKYTVFLQFADYSVDYTGIDLLPDLH